MSALQSTRSNTKRHQYYQAQAALLCSPDTEPGTQFTSLCTMYCLFTDITKKKSKRRGRLNWPPPPAWSGCGPHSASLSLPARSQMGPSGWWSSGLGFLSSPHGQGVSWLFQACHKWPWKSQLQEKQPNKLLAVNLFLMQDWLIANTISVLIVTPSYTRNRSIQHMLLLKNEEKMQS